MNCCPRGTILGELFSLYVLNLLPPDIGWRVAFGFGALAAASTAFVRKSIPQSLRWLTRQGELAGGQTALRDP